MAMVARRWEGLTVQDRIHRAAGRAIVGIGVLVAADTKRITHKVSGDLARSVHAAPPSHPHDGDEEAAKNGDLMLLPGQLKAARTPVGEVIEVGSWMPYACVEWEGRGHPGITEGLEAVRGVRADSIVRQAFREEGL